MMDLVVTATALRYPGPGAVDKLRSALEEMEPGTVRTELEKFVALVGELDVGEWEELHTRTLDLSPMFVPYVGHVAWGENYRRGDFMADMKRAQDAAGVDRAGELPDHLEPVMRYLAATMDPLHDLVEILPGAVASMRKDLKKADKDNPYRYVLAAAAAAIRQCLAQGAAV